MRAPLLSRIRVRPDDERGATLAIVAICLIALFGMVVLVVDVGGLLWKRREMVNGSDAAALAAAKTCALDDGYSGGMEGAADDWAMQNVGGLAADEGGVVADACEDLPGYVTVQYTNPQQLFFAPVLGAGESGDVSTRATAIWGTPGAANPVPIVVYANSFNSCLIETDPTPGEECYIWEDNNNAQGSQSGFGFLDLRTDNPSRYGWDSVAGAQCPDPGNGNGGVNDWISNYPSDDVGELPLNYPASTYVCRASGNRESSWNSLDDLEGEVLFFPINRCDAVPPGNAGGQIASNTSEVACGNTPHQYDIIGFVALRLIAVYDPKDDEVTGDGDACSFQASMSAGATYNLVSEGLIAGCFTDAPDTIDPDSVTVSRAGGPRPNPVECVGTTSGTCDWIYSGDPNQNVTWYGPGPAADNQNYDVTFDWSTGGVCGVPPSGNNSGGCLYVEVVDIQIGGSNPGGGSPDSNLRVVALCDPDIEGSCDPVAVP